MNSGTHGHRFLPFITPVRLFLSNADIAGDTFFDDTKFIDANDFRMSSCTIIQQSCV